MRGAARVVAIAWSLALAAGCAATTGRAAHATVSDDPDAPVAVERALHRIDRLLEEASHDKSEPGVRSTMAHAALDEIAPLERTYARDPELRWLEALAHLALVDRASGHRDADEARRALAALDEVDAFAGDGGRAVDVLVERGILLSKLSRVGEALAAYSRALSLHALAGPYATPTVRSDPLERPYGREALLLGNGADSLMALGRLDEAIAWYRRALDRTPKDAATLVAMPHFALGVALDRAGDAAASRDEIAAGLARDPDLAELRDENVFFVPAADADYYRALCQMARHEDDAAIESLRRYLGSSPPPPYARAAREHLNELSGHARTPP